MYLVSLYFDEKTNRRIQSYMAQVARHTGNHYMEDNHVPPHITISAFETREEERAVEMLGKVIPKLTSGNLTWASVGQFFPYVIYLAPVLNAYLHDLSCQVFQTLSCLEDISISKFYQPFQWLPHTTVGKKLTAEEMQSAFAVLLQSFGMFEGTVTEIGLAKTNPYEDVTRWELPLKTKSYT